MVEREIALQDSWWEDGEDDTMMLVVKTRYQGKTDPEFTYETISRVEFFKLVLAGKEEAHWL